MRRLPHHPQAEPTVARYFQSLGRDRFENNLSVHMFTEDVHLAVMPIGGRSQKQNKFSVTLDGSKEGCEFTEKIIRNIAQYDRHGIEKIVCDAVDEIAKHLSWEGCAVYELLPCEDDVPYPHSFTSKNLIKLGPWFLQIIPKGDWALWKKKWVLIPGTKIWRIEMPPTLGGEKGYLNILNELKRFDSLGPEFWQNNLGNSKKTKDFDFQRYIRSVEIYRSKVTKIWGWNRRDSSQDRSTEFYYFYKKVTFRLAQAVLREHIILELNALLGRLGIDCQIIVNGLPSPSEIDEIKRALLAGELSFASVSNKVSFS
jgi:hypothetical protein